MTKPNYKWNPEDTDFVPSGGRFVDHTGARFNLLTGMFPIGRSATHSHVYVVWAWRCDCGNRVDTTAYDVVRSHTISCGCTNKHANSSSWKGFESIPGKLLSTIRSSASKRGHEFSVSDEYLWVLYTRQEGMCALSGVPIEFKNINKGVTHNTASLDRICSTVGYVEGNLQWVHKHVNLMKNVLDQPYFLEMCAKITALNKEI
jgi:hypothetical protein